MNDEKKPSDTSGYAHMPPVFYATTSSDKTAFMIAGAAMMLYALIPDSVKQEIGRKALPLIMEFAEEKIKGFKEKAKQ